MVKLVIMCKCNTVPLQDHSVVLWCSGCVGHALGSCSIIAGLQCSSVVLRLCWVCIGILFCLCRITCVSCCEWCCQGSSTISNCWGRMPLSFCLLTGQGHYVSLNICFKRSKGRGLGCCSHEIKMRYLTEKLCGNFTAFDHKAAFVGATGISV